MIKTWLKANTAGIVFVLGIAVLCAVPLGMVAYAWLHRNDKPNAAAVAAAPVKVAEGQAALAGDAVQTLDQAGRRDRLTITVQQENARALAEAPDADLGVVLRRGLCRYAAYAADPECADLRLEHPPELP